MLKMMNMMEVEEGRLSLGAPRYRPLSGRFITNGGVQVTCQVEDVMDTTKEVDALLEGLDSHEGVLLASSYEFPGRYARWTIGFIDPPLKIDSRTLDFTVTALNARGEVLLEVVRDALLHPESPLPLAGLERGKLSEEEGGGTVLRGKVPKSEEYFPEEERSRQPSIFSVIRAVVDMFHSEGDPQFGLYGAFGYDLTFQFESIELQMPRPDNQRDVVLYIPDRVLVVDQDKRAAWRVEYDFSWKGQSTQGLPRTGRVREYQPLPAGSLKRNRDSVVGEYARRVEEAKGQFKVGNLFEVVLSQTFFKECPLKPSEVFARLRTTNPSPYGFLINLGGNEYLIGASPEMFVRCERTKEGLRVETCPISGTIARGSDALEDAARIKAILTNKKEESELTMCTDVDRNDKSRICEPGSVRVLGRRQIEMYSRLIHTVDHVEGYLRKGFDALDAFLCHTWAVTVTGAPKTWAIQFIEEQEASPRAWYGGAVGLVAFDGSLNTGLTLRTIRVLDGVAEVRAGATLLYDSDPPAEEAETELKASALVDALEYRGPGTGDDEGGEEVMPPLVPLARRVLLVDHEDSFVHTLANYLRQTGAEVSTVRSGVNALRLIEETRPDLVVLSPGPGCPKDFQLSQTISAALAARVPVFGVCLGLQGMVEHFGGKLDVLAYPMHGKPSHVDLTALSEATDGSSSSSSSSSSAGCSTSSTDSIKLGHKYKIFEGIPQRFEVARYHSLHGNQATFPKELRVTAMSEDGVIMGIEHRDLPLAAVQFHPESILTNPTHGLRMLANALKYLQFEEDKK